MEQKETLVDVKARFEKNLDQYFAQNQECLARHLEKSKIDEYYFLVKYKLPDELRAWILNELDVYKPLVTESIEQIIHIEEKEQHCFDCDKHRRKREWVESKLQNPPVLDLPKVKPNNVLYQGFGTFGMIFAGLYILTSYLPFRGIYFHLVQALVAGGIGLYYGVKTYQKYDQSYRQALFEVGIKFLAESQKKIREWFEQIDTFDEKENELC